MEEIKAKMEHLQQVSMKLGELLYKQQAESAEQPAEETHNNDDNVVDADYKEKK